MFSLGCLGLLWASAASSLTSTWPSKSRAIQLTCLRTTALARACSRRSPSSVPPLGLESHLHKDYLDNLESFFYLLTFLVICYHPDGTEVVVDPKVKHVGKQELLEWPNNSERVSFRAKEGFIKVPLVSKTLKS